jgi:hypothetical protein
MKIETILSGAFVVGVAALSLGFFFSKEPEYVTAGSEDGVLTIRGVARESQPFSVETIGHNMSLPLIGMQYTVGPAGVTLDVPVGLTMRFTEPGQEAIYHLDEKRQMWEEMKAVTGVASDSVSIETDELGEFSLGTKEEVTAPEFLSVYDELLSFAPKNAVGYETSVGYRHDGGSIVRLEGQGETGGCGGIMGTGDGEELSTKERTANVLVNDVETPVTFVFRTRFLTASNGTTCTEEKPLSPAPGYAILPQ